MNFDDFLNESKITLKRQYTEAYPAKTAGKHANVRNRVIEAIKDGMITKADFKAILKEMSADDSRWLRRNAGYFNVTEDQVSLSKHGQKILNHIIMSKENSQTTNESNSEIKVGDTVSRKFIGEDPTQTFTVVSISGGKAKLKDTKTGKENGMHLSDLIKETEEVDESGYRPMTDAERQKAQYKKNQLARLKAVDKKEEEGKRLRALQQKLHQQRTKKANETFIYESFADFVENELNEKAYQLTSSYGAKGIPGKVLFAFKKHVEHVKFEGDAKSTLENINKEWSKWADKEGAKIIEQEVMKQVKDKESIVYIVATLSGEEWDEESSNENQLIARIPMDFVINIGFADDVDSNKFSKKLGGMQNAALLRKNNTEIVGKYEREVGENNVEIRSGFYLSFDSK
jgi:hypothetical protein